MNNLVIFLIFVVFSGSSLAADLIYLECKVSSLTTELSVTLNEAAGKATQTYKANGSGFTADAYFNPGEIIYQKNAANLQQVDRFSINRRTLAITHSIFLYGKGVATVSGNGTCKIAKPEQNKI